MSNGYPFLRGGTINVSNIWVSDGRHNGIVDFHIEGGLTLKQEACDALRGLPVEGIDEVIIRHAEPVIRFAATPNPSGEPMTWRQLQKLADSLKKALVAWAGDFTPEDRARYTTHQRADRSDTWAVYSEVPRG